MLSVNQWTDNKYLCHPCAKNCRYICEEEKWIDHKLKEFSLLEKIENKHMTSKVTNNAVKIVSFILITCYTSTDMDVMIGFFAWVL